MQFILLSTEACHLCEQAEALLQTHFPHLSFEIIDIAEQTQWQAEYALKIPVLYHQQTARYLAWRFDAVDVTAFLAELHQNSA